jgi:hypothetical protein
MELKMVILMLLHVPVKQIIYLLNHFYSLILLPMFIKMNLMLNYGLQEELLGNFKNNFSAAPVYFDPFYIGDDIFVDG